MRTVTTDVLIVGSGFGAAAPALRLSRAGYGVIMVEKGPSLDPRSDFRQTQDPLYLTRYIKGLAGDRLNATYAEALGGASGFYEMVSLRTPSKAFQQADTRGRRLWPTGLDRVALDPFYDVAERMLRIEQIPANEVPKTGLLFAKLMRNLGYSCDRAPYAVQGCIGSGFCVTGCIYGAKQSLLLNYLPRARAAGAEIRTELEAVSIRRSTSDPAQTLRFLARLVVLAGGTVGTARLLLASRQYLPGLSDEVGRNICFNGSVKVAGLLPDHFPDGDMFTGRSHPGMISYEFLESRGLTIATAKPLPLQLVVSARIRLASDPRDPAYWGQANLELMQRFRRRGIVLFALGLTPPGGVLTLNRKGEPRLHLAVDDSLREYYRDTGALLRSILKRNGGHIITAEFRGRDGRMLDEPYFSTGHPTGSCRMADNPTNGVVSATGEVFGSPGLYVSDGSVIPTSLAVNTSLTILANAERIAAGILGAYPATGTPPAS
jgi:choline dehydrogenase-like flavoprotein